MTMKHGDSMTREELQGEIEQLRYRLDEAEQTLEAIRSGDVDALVVAGPHGDQIFSLTGSERVYRRIVETMNEGALTVGLDGTILFCNQRFCDLIRYDMGEIIGRNFAHFSPRAQLPQLKVFLDEAQAGPMQRYFLLRVADGANVSVNIAASILVSDTENSLCLVVSDLTALEVQASSINDLLKQKNVMEMQQTELQSVNEELRESEEALKESEEQLRSLADSIPNLAWWANGDGYITWYNQRWYEYTGTTPELMEGWGWQSVHDPIELPKVMERWQASITTGEPFEMTFPLRGADGVFRPFLTRVIPRKDDAGRVLRWFGTNTDVSMLIQAEAQIKASLAEKEVMLKEIHHRVKNNLQVISSLVSLQADTLADERIREEFNDVRDRVRSMALVHEKLYQTGDLAHVNFADYTASLLQYLWRSHGALAGKVRLELAVAPVALPIEAAVPCGLILNELAGNALKHAFPDNSSGEVTVCLELDPATETVSLWVRDNGVGLPVGLDWRQSRSLGLRLIQMLAGQLRGTVETGPGPGAEFRITFPLKGFQS